MTTTHTPTPGTDTPQTMTIRYADGTTTTLRAVHLGIYSDHLSWEGKSPDPDDGGALVSLLGFSATLTPAVSGYPEAYRPPLFYMAHGMFGWGAPVAEVTL